MMKASDLAKNGPQKQNWQPLSEIQTPEYKPSPILERLRAQQAKRSHDPKDSEQDSDR